MSSKTRRSGADRGKEAGEDGVVVDRKMIETIKEATGASEDDIRVILQECNYDANETTSRLIDNPFSQVQSKKDKKKKREEDRKKEPAAKVVEVRRSSGQGGRGRGHDRERGPRGDRGDRGGDRGKLPINHQNSRGRSQQTVPAVAPLKQPQLTPEPEVSGWGDTVAYDSDLQQNGQALSPAAQDSAAWTAAPVQPTAAPPSPIRPPGTRTGAKSMADLFKRPQESTLPRPTAVAPSTAAVAPAAIAPEPASTTLKAPESHGEANGWDSLHVTDTESLRQGGSLGGVAISAPQKSHGSQPLPIQAGAVASQTPVGGSLSSVPASPGRQQHLDEPVSVPSTAGLGGMPVEAPPRQSYSEGPAAAWSMPKAPSAAAATPTLGSSILSSLGGSAASSAAAADPLAPQPSATQPSDLGLGQAPIGSHSPVILPPSAQQAAPELGGLSFQFGNFGLGSSDGGGFGAAGLASAFQAAPSASSAPSSELPAGSDALRPASYGHAQAGLQQQVPSSQQQQQQRAAYTAFASAAAQSQQPQKPAASAAAEVGSVGSVGSQALYGSQGYQSYGASPGYGQYAAPAAQAAQYQAYSYQAPAETAAPPAISAAPQQAAAAAPAKRTPAYEAPGYSAYSQPAPPAKDYQAASSGRYSSSGAPGQSHLAAPGPAAAAVAGQTPLSQVSGYGAGQVGGMAPQGYGYGAGQQFGGYQPYAGYGHPGSGYGYGQSSYGGGAGGYNQGGKYGRSGYGAGYQQHAGGYGSQPHKQEKDHQAAHLAGHDLYGQQQQQLPLGGQQHYQGAGLREHAGYGYQNQSQGYGGYGMGRQYNQPYYGREQ